MILEDKINFWTKEGVPVLIGELSEDNEDQDDSLEVLEFTKETLEDGSFVEAIMFQLFYEAWITVDEWDSTEKKVKELLTTELENLIP